MTPDDVHLSIDQLADLEADVLTPDEATTAGAHVRSCESCRATYDLIAGVPALLAGTAPPPIPADVTARVVAAIEREQIAREVGASEPAAAPSGARREPAGLRRRFGARLGAGLLGAAAVLGGGYLVVDSDLMGGADDEAPAAGMSAEDSAQGETLADDGTADRTAPAPESHDGPEEYTASSLDEDVQQLLTDREEAGLGAATPGETDDVLGPDGAIGEPDDVQTKACIAAVQSRADTDEEPIAVDLSTFEGTPAYVVVLPDGTRATARTPVDVWIVGTSCLDELEVLEHQSVLP